MAVALACAASELAWRFPGTASNPGNPLFHLMGNSSAHGTFKQGEAGKIPYLLERFRPCVLARGAYIALGQNAPSRINILVHFPSQHCATLSTLSSPLIRFERCPFASSTYLPHPSSLMGPVSTGSASIV